MSVRVFCYRDNSVDKRVAPDAVKDGWMDAAFFWVVGVVSTCFNSDPDVKNNHNTLQGQAPQEPRRYVATCWLAAGGNHMRTLDAGEC